MNALYNIVTQDRIFFHLSFPTAWKKARLLEAALSIAYEEIKHHKTPTSWEWYIWQGNKRVILLSVERVSV
jgi:hypothetical protein